MAAERLLLGGRKLAAKGAVLKSQGTLPDAPGTATPSGPQGAAQALNRIMVRHFQDPSWENAYVQVELPDALSGLQQAIEHGFAKSLIGVRGTTPAARSLNGINTAGRLFVNVEANVGFLNVAGHELFHQLKKDRPDLYQWFAGQARSHYQHLPAYKAKLDALLQPGETPYSREAAEEELLADRVVVAPAGFSP